MENKNEQQVPEIMPEPIEEPKKSKKGQMAKGVACGIAGTILVGFVALNVVTKITGTKIYITNATAKTDSILDTKTVQKINELKAYTDMYYYDDVDDTELKDGLYEGKIRSAVSHFCAPRQRTDFPRLKDDIPPNVPMFPPRHGSVLPALSLPCWSHLFRRPK